MTESDDKPSDALGEIRLVVGGAKPLAEPPATDVPDDAPPAGDDLPAETGGETGGGDGDGPSRQLRKGELPPDCAVTPLGVESKTCWYLDSNGQLIGIRRRDHSKLEITGLFGTRADQLYKYWPQRKQDKDTGGWLTTGWQAQDVAESLMAVASDRGVWDVFNRLRGTGTWLGQDGDLVMHCGDVVYHRHEYRPPGLFDKHVYPAAPPMPRPFDEPGAAAEKPGDILYDLLSSWHWRRGDTDVVLMLGWIGAAMLGAALDWRPLAWITGDLSTGKSTLHRMLQRVFDGGILSVTDTTAAGVWQKLGHSSLPVAIDELEAEADNSRTQAVIKLAREAASGGMMLRGGADHGASSFTVRCCFLFSSILVPPLQPQDHSRIAILDLLTLKPDTDPPNLEPAWLARVGALVRRRLVDQWHRWPATLETYRVALGKGRVSSRGADVYGTLLACADMLLNDERPLLEDVAAWGVKLGPDINGEDRGHDHDHCLEHIRTVLSDAFKGGVKETLGQIIARACGYNADGGEDGEFSDLSLSSGSPNHTLGVYGLRVIELPVASRLYWLAVANAGGGIARLFANTHWAGGPHIQALRRITGYRVGGNDGTPSTLSIGGSPSRYTLVPMDRVLPRVAAGGSGSNGSSA